MTSDYYQPEATLNTAVLFLVFNRPDTTKQVFEAIRRVKPPRLYVAADGPREDREGEAERVVKVREIATAVDWPCEVKTLFRDKNLGCKSAVSCAITWFFEHEEQGIILEDDCLPSRSFFYFCEELLYVYKENNNIMLISGYNKQQTWGAHRYDYFFSNFGGIWGWASWRRAWQLYDGAMSGLEDMAESDYFENLLGKRLGRQRKRQLINAKKAITAGKINTWDFAWAFSRHKNEGLACVPSVSLIQNIGFGAGATHTKGEGSDSVKAQELEFPLRINHEFSPDKDYDFKFIEGPSLIGRTWDKLKSLY